MNNCPVRELFNFAGKVVCVTGSSGGIGGGIARRFSEAGANLALHYHLNREKALKLQAEMKSAGNQAILVGGDLSHPETVDAVLDRIFTVYGRLDILINNAGCYLESDFLEMSNADWDSIFTANLHSVHLCTQAAAKRMAAQQTHGAIINIASIEGLQPAWGHVHYATAKAGVIMHTKASALELGEHHIRVNCVSPGLIWRPGIEEQWPEGVERWKAASPSGRLGQTEDVANACLFLASPAASWITGVNLVVDGGISVCPLF